MKVKMKATLTMTLAANDVAVSILIFADCESIVLGGLIVVVAA